MRSVSAEKGIALELAQRQKQIEKRLEGLRFESEEVSGFKSEKVRLIKSEGLLEHFKVWKSLEASDRQLLQMYNSDFKEKEEPSKWRQDILVTYQYYLKVNRLTTVYLEGLRRRLMDGCTSLY